MNLLKGFARVLTILGPICIAVGFISLFFFQIHHGEITLPNNFRSNTFDLVKGKTYSIKVSGSNYPFGASGGNITLYLSNGRPVRSFNIQFSFDGDSTAQEIIIGDFSVTISGEYYFEYVEEYSSLYSPVKLIVQESLTEYLVGFDSFEIMVFGVALLIAGYILPKGANWISNRMTVHSSEQKYESLEMDGNIEITEFEEEIICPNCGFIDDGLYCSNCGSRLR
ncbi:MAG: hypothetical protein ACFFDC_17760 [Promethearchaeota archaeon]